MTARTIEGKAIAARVLEEVQQATRMLQSDKGVQPGIAVVIAGEDPASQVYVRNKGQRAEDCGFHSRTLRLPDTISRQELLATIAELNEDRAIHGILVQLPLPGHIEAGEIIQAISPAKDVDGFHFENVGRLGTGQIDDAFVPCTPAGAMVMIRDALGSDDLSGKSAVVIGRSNIVGKPMAHLLLSANATVTIAHSRTKDLPSVARQADILVAAVGRPQMVRADWIKPGACVIDVGINRIDAPERGEGKTRLVGDVAFDECSEVAGAITPVPGGVGVMTIAMLMANTVRAAYLATGREAPRF